MSPAPRQREESILSVIVGLAVSERLFPLAGAFPRGSWQGFLSKCCLVWGAEGKWGPTESRGAAVRAEVRGLKPACFLLPASQPIFPAPHPLRSPQAARTQAAALDVTPSPSCAPHPPGLPLLRGRDKALLTVCRRIIRPSLSASFRLPLFTLRCPLACWLSRGPAFLPQGLCTSCSLLECFSFRCVLPHPLQILPGMLPSQEHPLQGLQHFLFTQSDFIFLLSLSPSGLPCIFLMTQLYRHLCDARSFCPLNS